MKPAAYAFYTAALYLFSPALAVHYFYKMRKRRMVFAGMAERLGTLPALPPPGGEVAGAGNFDGHRLSPFWCFVKLQTAKYCLSSI